MYLLEERNTVMAVINREMLEEYAKVVSREHFLEEELMALSRGGEWHRHIIQFKAEDFLDTFEEYKVKPFGDNWKELIYSIGEVDVIAIASPLDLKEYYSF